MPVGEPKSAPKQVEQPVKAKPISRSITGNY
jgi:hypothetical protein